MPDDHSEVVPLLPIPNRTVKRLCADDSADTRVKVGHRQAIQPENAPSFDGAFLSEPLYKGVLIKTKVFCLSLKNCVIIEGFADHGEARSRSQVLRRSLKIYSR